MTLRETDTPRRRRARALPSAEALESRQVLSAAAMTVALDAPADGMIGGMATAPALVVDGHAMPGARVEMLAGKKAEWGYADASGNYQLRMKLPSGTYQVKVKARDVAGRTAQGSMTATKGDAVLAWISTMDDVIKADAENVGLASRTMAMVSGAMYDAVNDVERTGSVYKVDVPAPAGASPSVAASEAAYAVLSALDPKMRPMIEVAMAQSLAANPSPVGQAGGEQVGLEVAQGILAWRADDGSAAIVPYVPGTSPGRWRPTPPNDQVAWGPEWGEVAPFGVTKPVSAFQPPSPPALDSPAYAAALNQVEALGGVDSKIRTPEQSEVGLFWSYDAPSTGTPPVHYDQIARTIALQEHNSLAQDARLFGLVNVAMGDAGIAAWDAKYTDNLWRPVTAIQEADTDGNPATTADPTWMPLGAPGAPGQPNYTPAFPGYVSGHATFGQALFTTLDEFYGTDRLHFTLTSDQTPGVTRSYSSFTQASLENAESRIDLGLHFWFDETAGITMGAEIARNITAHVMTPDRA